MHHLAANVIAIAACSSANFLVNHRVVFAPALWLLVLALSGGKAVAADLSPAAAAAFDREARVVEARLDDERAGKSPFLWIDSPAGPGRREARAQLARGEVVVQRLPPLNQKEPNQKEPNQKEANDKETLPGAMLHHWIATTLVTGRSLDRVVMLMQGYNRYAEVYSPAVRRSREIARDGDTFSVALQLFTKKVISVILNTESTVTYLPITAKRMQVRSVSTRIAEVSDPGTPEEREAPIGRDSGFLWRFNNYCALDEQEEGTYVQCETLSLTRDTPFGLGWIIAPFVTAIPRESLEFTLGAMRTSLQGGAR
jgi:hypothetical protein